MVMTSGIDQSAQLYAILNEAERWAKDNKAQCREKIKEALTLLNATSGVDRIEITKQGHKVGSATLVMEDAHLIVSDREAFDDFALAHGFAREVIHVEPDKDWEMRFRIDGDEVVFVAVDTETGEVTEQLCNFVQYVPRHPAYPTLRTTKEFKAEMRELLDGAVAASLDPVGGIAPALLPALDMVRPQGGR
jgi:hypothetical protein